MTRHPLPASHPPAPSKPRNRTVPRKTSQLPGADTEPCRPQQPKTADKGKAAFRLHGDVKSLEFAFVETRRRLVGTTVPESIYLKMQKHPGSISGFYEDAVAAFDGDLPSLVEAAVQFVKQRKLRASSDSIRNANGRIYFATFERIQEIEKALKSIKGMSRAKVIAGLIQLFLTSLSE